MKFLSALLAAATLNVSVLAAPTAEPEVVGNLDARAPVSCNLASLTVNKVEQH